MKFKTIAALVCSTALVSGCMPANTSVDGVVKGQERSSGPFGMIKADAVKVTSESSFKDVQEVTVGNFVVGFATYKTDSAKAGNFMTSGFGGKSKAKSTLIGIDDATMQKITDSAYKDFVADLKAKGYKVVDHSALEQNAQFAKAKTYENGLEDSSGGLFGTSSKTKFFAPTGYKVRSIGDVPGLSGGFAFDNPLHGVTEYAKQSNVKVLSMVYVLDFANAESYGGLSSSSVNVGHGMTAVPDFTKLTLVRGEMGTFSNGVGSLTIGQPISSDKSFGEIKNTNSDAYKAAEVATNVLGTLAGVGSNVTREYDVNAKPAAYSAAALDVLKQTNDAILSKAASLK